MSGGKTSHYEKLLKKYLTFNIDFYKLQHVQILKMKNELLYTNKE